MDWSDVGKVLAPMAPTIGGILGGLIPVPFGSTIGSGIGTAVAAALGVPPTPDAVHAAVTTMAPDEITARLAVQEAQVSADVEKYKAQLEDVQDARRVGLEYSKADSKIQWAPTVVSIIAVAGFCLFSYMAITRPPGADRDVLMYLLGIWSGAFLTVLNFWLGTSASSQGKSDQLAAIASTSTAAAVKKK